MTIHLPGRAAAQAEIAPDLARIMAEQAEREAAEVALHARNKEVLFDGLRLVGIDLPRVFHPATTGARWSFTPVGAV